ncbi:hypothetical protein IEE84_09810 [Psychrobacter sp. 28M-43]|uniref:hypothetical protein n=1 Tax=Psychrobacter sp. 28M-43 TaxID=2772254 RepID=UPI00168CE6B7|nr:hypothetical protein [Psychrobacter sp. 28M-43]QOD12177.1 hypothetical protein IEE84_09810 [Psychrobacter sp. 28M-43]
MTRSIKQTIKNQLYGNSAGKCNLCSYSLLKESESENSKYYNIGQIAHIEPYADNPIAPRYKAIDCKAQNNSYQNLILLCANCHLKIDNDPNYYTVDRLISIKENFTRDIQIKLTEVRESDFYVVNLINEFYDVQSIYFELENSSLSVIYSSILRIGDINNICLNSFKPYSYPFDDANLNSMIQNIIDLYRKLSYYFYDCYDLNQEIFQSNKEFLKLTGDNRKNIEEIMNLLRSSLYSWLEYTRPFKNKV